jgi:predicted KAP-like P-loop ATPase
LGAEKQGIEKAISVRYKENPRMDGVKYLEKIIQLPFFLTIPQSEDIKAYTKKLVGAARLEQTQRIIDDGGGRNPRRIKRFLNAFTLLHTIAPDENLKNDVLAKIVMIQLRFPEFYQFLCTDHDAIDNLLMLNDGEMLPDWPRHQVYEKWSTKTELVDFLIRTRDIKPSIWDPYLRLATMISS